MNIADMTAAEKNMLITARIQAMIASGSTVPEALDSVLGEGTYSKLKGDLYDALRAKAGLAT